MQSAKLRFWTEGAQILGYLQIVCGIQVLISQIVVTVIGDVTFKDYAGFWASRVVCDYSYTFLIRA